VRAARNQRRDFESRCWVVYAETASHLLPIGAVGELVIEAPAAGRGYLNPKANEVSFVDNPTWLKDVLS
jgi:acyl-CoA synthetase (AMP-forming)/AMP-acid ligase II